MRSFCSDSLFLILRRQEDSPENPFDRRYQLWSGCDAKGIESGSLGV